MSGRKSVPAQWGIPGIRMLIQFVSATNAQRLTLHCFTIERSTCSLA